MNAMYIKDANLCKLAKQIRQTKRKHPFTTEQKEAVRHLNSISALSESYYVSLQPQATVESHLVSLQKLQATGCIVFKMFLKLSNYLPVFLFSLFLSFSTFKAR